MKDERIPNGWHGDDGLLKNDFHERSAVGPNTWTRHGQVGVSTAPRI
jgi:hypothetical protein